MKSVPKNKCFQIVKQNPSKHFTGWPEENEVDYDNHEISNLGNSGPFRPV